jgi:hypothetical protein
MTPVEPRKINLRHAAALALVGWYLLAPPMTGEPGKGKVHAFLDTPISQWTQYGGFDSAAECSNARVDQLAKLEPAKDEADHDAKVIWSAISRFVCIASDDPRLKEK